MKNMSHLVYMGFVAFSMSFGAFSLVSGFHVWFLWGCKMSFFLPVFFLVFFSCTWWGVVGRERISGEHTSVVEDGIKLGMVLFIMSEVLFFFTFFWSFFHYTFSPSPDLGNIWPPIFLKVMNPNNIPLVNTLILLSSGATITWAHSDLLSNQKSMNSLSYTFSLGLYFLLIQAMEYYMSSITMSDGSYGSIFFIATGFHGIHVLVGTVFLMVMYYRFLKNRFSSWSHMSCELAIWYWHFVDVVWLFLFSFIYYWGS